MKYSENFFRITNSIVLALFAFVFFSCSEDTPAGHWSGSAREQDDESDCITIEFDVTQTESGQYYGNGVVSQHDCKTRELRYSSEFSMSSIVFDKPLFYFEASLDGGSGTRYKFKGTVGENTIGGKLSTWTQYSEIFDVVYDIKLEKGVK